MVHLTNGFFFTSKRSIENIIKAEVTKGPIDMIILPFIFVLSKVKFHFYSIKKHIKNQEALNGKELEKKILQSPS